MFVELEGITFVKSTIRGAHNQGQSGPEGKGPSGGYGLITGTERVLSG